MSSAVAAVSCATVATCVAQSSLVNGSRLKSAKTVPALGLPVLSSRSLKADRVVCSASKPEEVKSNIASLAAAMTAVSSMAAAHPALALVDERLSGEGTGLPLGLNDTSLTWVMVAAFGLVWALYFTFTSGLDDKDSDSGLSL